MLNLDVLIAAIITTIMLGVILVGIQIRMKLSGKLYYFSVVCALPLSYLINQIKTPILIILFQQKVLDNGLTLEDGILWVLIVGFTEEMIKFIVFILILHFISENRVKNSSVVAYGVGIGFGIGEIWWLVSIFLFLNAPNLLGLEWTTWLSGFGLERFFVTFGHAAIFMVVLFGYRRNLISTLLFLAVSMIIHACYDFPIILNQLGIINSLQMVLIVILELIVGFVASFYLLDYFTRLSEDKDRNRRRTELLIRAHDSF